MCCRVCLSQQELLGAYRADIGNAVAQEADKHLERSYGLVVALQVSLPIVAVHAVQSLNADFPDHAQPLFQFCLSEVQYTLAAEDRLQDIRWACDASAAWSISVIVGMHCGTLRNTE